MPPPYFQDVIPTDPPLVTETPSATATFTETASSTPSETATATHTATTLPTSTETLTATYTETPGETPSVTLDQASATLSPTATPTLTASATLPGSNMPVATPTPQFAATPSMTATYSGETQAGIVAAPVAVPVMAASPVNVTAATVAQLITQINAANARCPTPTIITLTATTYTLTAVNDASFYGSNGLPIIRCDITITGGSSNRIIQRNTPVSTPLFRIFGVDSSGILRLNRVIVRYGRASDTGGSGMLIIQGQAYLTNSQVVSNTLSLTTINQIIGAGIYNYLGTLRVENSIVSSNMNTSTTADGGGIGVIGGNTTLIGATVNSNRANRTGGGMAILQSAASVSITSSTFLSNIGGAGGGGGIYNAAGISITRSLLQSNTLLSGTLGAALYSSGNGSNPVISNSCFISNGDTAAASISGASLTARNNWWGSSSGPVVNGSSVNPRDSVTSAITYQPFVTIAPANPAVTCLNGVVPPTPTPTATAPICTAALAGGEVGAAQSCPTSTATPSPTLTAAPTTWHVVCNVAGGVANARNFPSAVFIGAPPTPQIDGQLLMIIPAGTILDVFQFRADSNGVNWARIIKFGGYNNGETLWVRQSDPAGAAIIQPGNPTGCTARMFNLAATPRPTVVGTYPTVAPGCNSGNVCPLFSTTGWTDTQAVAWILACEAGNGGRPEERDDALGIAHVIRNRMRSLLYEGSAREVISQQGQFDCWIYGASASSNLSTINSVVDPEITRYAQILVQGGALADPFNNGIRWYGLYTYGLFNNASNRDVIRQTPTAVIGLLNPICTPPGGVGNIYIDIGPFGSRFNATAFFNSFPSC